MNVCLLTHNIQKNTEHGVDRYSLELCERVKRCFNLTILSQGNISNALYRSIKEAVFPIRIIPVQADIYHAVSPQIAKAAVLTNKFPLVATIHDLIPIRDSLTSFYQRKVGFNGLLRLEYLRLCTFIATKSDILIVPFEVTRRDLVSTLGVRRNKIRVISYGVDTEFFRPLKLSDNVIREKRGKKVVFFVGGFSPAKGVDVLMKAFSYVLKKDQEAELWVCGKWSFFDGMELARKLGVFEHMRFLGHIPEKQLPVYYNLADVVVLPYKIGFSFPILEGMACGRAVITSDTPDIKEIVGDSVISVSPTDVEELAESLCYVLANDSVREEIAYQAYQKSQSLSWDVMAKKTMDVYLQLCEDL